MEKAERGGIRSAHWNTFLLFQEISWGFHSPWVLSASDRRGTALCPPITSPASSACRGRCPWTASPDNCGEAWDQFKWALSDSLRVVKESREKLTSHETGRVRFQEWKHPTAQWPDKPGGKKSSIKIRLEWYLITSLLLQAWTSTSAIMWVVFAVPASYVFVLHVFEKSQLSVGPFGKKFGLERPVEFLDGHLCPYPAVPCWTDEQENRFYCQTEI